MPVKQTIPYNHGTIFITFTCYKWLSLIEKVNGYDIIYNWFDHLKSKGHYINGYVIMPNHVHVLLSFTETSKIINTIVGNGKRFMAYEIIKRLKALNESALLRSLEKQVEPHRKKKNKQHEVWELSFDWKKCNSDKFIYQKLDYIHDNPCSKRWNLCKIASEYPHSSAEYYIMGKQGVYQVDDVEKMKDIILLKV